MLPSIHDHVDVDAIVGSMDDRVLAGTVMPIKKRDCSISKLRHRVNGIGHEAQLN